MKDELKRVINEYVQIVESDENRKRQDKWVAEPVVSREKFRRIPEGIESGGIPIVVDIAWTVYAKKYSFDMEEFYTKPEIFICNYLKSMIDHFSIGDDTTFSKNIPFVPTGSPFAASLFGADPLYDHIEEPMIKHQPVIDNKESLCYLESPDFFRSGLMPLIHKFYNEINEILDSSECILEFPNILRSPYGIATQLRGFTQFAYDLMDDPDWVHSLMKTITKGRKK